MYVCMYICNVIILMFSQYNPEQLSESCVRLLETHEMSDMHLVLVDPQTHNSSDSVHPFTDEGTKQSSIVIPAHR